MLPFCKAQVRNSRGLERMEKAVYSWPLARESFMSADSIVAFQCDLRRLLRSSPVAAGESFLSW